MSASSSESMSFPFDLENVDRKQVECLRGLHLELSPFDWYASENNDPWQEKILRRALPHFQCHRCDVFSKDFFAEDEHAHDGTLFYVRCHQCRPSKWSTQSEDVHCYMVCVLCPATSIPLARTNLMSGMSSGSSEKNVPRFLRTHLASKQHKHNLKKLAVQSMPLRKFPDCRQFGTSRPEPGGATSLLLGTTPGENCDSDSDTDGSDSSGEEEGEENDDNDNDDEDDTSSDDGSEEDEEDTSESSDSNEDQEEEEESESSEKPAARKTSEDDDVLDNPNTAGAGNNSNNKVSTAKAVSSSSSSSSSEFETIELDTATADSSRAIPPHVAIEFARYKHELLKLYSNQELLTEVERRMGA